MPAPNGMTESGSASTRTNARRDVQPLAVLPAHLDRQHPVPGRLARRRPEEREVADAPGDRRRPADRHQHDLDVVREVEQRQPDGAHEPDADRHRVDDRGVGGERHDPRDEPCVGGARPVHRRRRRRGGSTHVVPAAGGACPPAAELWRRRSSRHAPRSSRASILRRPLAHFVRDLVGEAEALLG